MVVTTAASCARCGARSLARNDDGEAACLICGWVDYASPIALGLYEPSPGHPDTDLSPARGGRPVRCADCFERVQADSRHWLCADCGYCHRTAIHFEASPRLHPASFL